MRLSQFLTQPSNCKHRYLPRCLYSNYPPLYPTLTGAVWVTACPCTTSLAGTHVVLTQCVASIASEGGSRTHKSLVLSLWVVAHHSIWNGQGTTVHNYRRNDVIMTLVGIHMYRLCLR